MQSEISTNLAAVRERIAAACRRAGRAPEEVTLLAVSKTKPESAIREALAAGQYAFGENYVQELTAKIASFEKAGKESGPDRISWHMIGHLQRNKVKYIVGRVDLIHSVDSMPLALQIQKEAEKKDCLVNVLLEVNAALEESKWGVSPQQTRETLAELAALPNVCVSGLMTSAPYTTDPETNRMYFRELKRLGDLLAAEGLLYAADPECTGKAALPAPVLSMGMSGDFEVAVEEGATIVRVGSSIFGEREYH